MSVRQLANQLAEILAVSQGSLNCESAKLKLEERAGRPISDSEYQHAKSRLINQGRIVLASDGRELSLASRSSGEVDQEGGQSRPGQGSSSVRVTHRQRVDRLFLSLSSIPGIKARRNSRGITLLFGDDGDKLFAYWDPQKRQYFFQYRIERGTFEDHSADVEKIFLAIDDGANYTVARSISSVGLYVGDSISECHRVCAQIKNHLDGVCLGNAHAAFGVPKRIDLRKYYLEAARVIKYAVEEDLALVRLSWRQALAFDDVDELIVVGDSGKGSLCVYREHAVPVCLIKDEAINMAKDGAPTRVIADFIRHHLYIVMITNEEARMLNSSPENGGAGLKTCMPECWEIGQDPFARLKSVGIAIRFYRLHSAGTWKQWKKNWKDSLWQRANKRIFRY